MACNNWRSIYKSEDIYTIRIAEKIPLAGARRGIGFDIQGRIVATFGIATTGFA
jgi:hypothetical protein